MRSPRADTRRHLPTSPFAPPPPAPPLENFVVEDLVTHDKYGLGRVLAVEEGTAVIIDFGPQKVRIPAPFTKLAKL
ncbi:hypothetical protein [Actinomadura sp. 9N407]|uniref:hypothetical protein n=1 Tax=Actinomadura sp. 9N407 TaxID=3375154 RepID=UPI0037983A73